MLKKICVVTGTRAEYGLLYWLMKATQQEETLLLQLLVTGMHLSPEFGLTYQQIEKDGFTIDKKVEMLLSSDTEIGMGKSMGLAMISFTEAFNELKPDLIMLVGDRFETFIAATAATVCRIPVAHCHGGEITEGAIDDAMRHAITKMSHLHFVSTEAYRKRVVQMGENPANVYNVGALGIESINKMQLMDRPALEASLGITLTDKLALVTFHPVTMEKNSARQQFEELLEALDAYPHITFIFTKANADTEGRVINQLLDEFAATRKNVAAFTSLGQLRYLSVLKLAHVVIGNSSSGLLEAPSFKVPTVNIGNRQSGRVRGVSVIDCAAAKNDIRNAINKALTADFRAICEAGTNPYGEKNASESIMPVLKSTDVTTLFRKHFYDL